MADKQKKGSDTLKSQRKIVLSGLRLSQYVRKKYTLKMESDISPKQAAMLRSGAEWQRKKLPTEIRAKIRKRIRLTMPFLSQKKTTAVKNEPHISRRIFRMI